MEFFSPGTNESLNKYYMIFISYRRSDGKAAALLIKDGLINRGFDEGEIFLDLHDILAENFVERCRNTINTCDTFILVVTKDSFKSKDGFDYYFDEIHHALAMKKKIVPITYETIFNEDIIPEEFKDKNLHNINSIRYDIEFKDASFTKIIDAITKGEHTGTLKKLAQCFAIPLVFITIYIGISLIGGVIRYVWDNYWLSDSTCIQYASKHVIDGGNGIYYYSTCDTLYIFNSNSNKISLEYNIFSPNNNLINLAIPKAEAYEAGFWTLAIGMVYEMSKTKIKPHGNNKQVAVIIAATISVAAGFGFGFTIERMIFPVQESKMIRSKLHSAEWWNKIIMNKRISTSINHKF